MLQKYRIVSVWMDNLACADMFESKWLVDFDYTDKNKQFVGPSTTLKTCDTFEEAYKHGKKISIEANVPLFVSRGSGLERF